MTARGTSARQQPGTTAAQNLKKATQVNGGNMSDGMIAACVMTARGHDDDMTTARRRNTTAAEHDGPHGSPQRVYYHKAFSFADCCTATARLESTAR